MDIVMRDAVERVAKSELEQQVQDRGIAQIEAAALFGIQQADVSDAVGGKLSRFSMARLERLLNSLDFEIRIQVGPRPDGKPHAGISVQTVEPF